ncbi:TPA: hypothetical protein DCY65_02815, partial [Candidatus Acetothermia bacterium]|nr:hypothetical protein [Candidatus Acetothermia bacterium]
DHGSRTTDFPCELRACLSAAGRLQAGLCAGFETRSNMDEWRMPFRLDVYRAESRTGWHAQR